MENPDQWQVYAELRTLAGAKINSKGLSNLVIRQGDNVSFKGPNGEIEVKFNQLQCHHNITYSNTQL